MRIFGKGKCKFIANFSATMVTSLPSLSISLSVSLPLSHRKYLTHNIGSASALPIIPVDLIMTSSATWKLLCRTTLPVRSTSTNLVHNPRSVMLRFSWRLAAESQRLSQLMVDMNHKSSDTMSIMTPANSAITTYCRPTCVFVKTRSSSRMHMDWFSPCSDKTWSPCHHGKRNSTESSAMMSDHCGNGS